MYHHATAAAAGIADAGMDAGETEAETVALLQATDVRDLFPTFSAEDAGSRVCGLCRMRLKDKTHNLTRHLERHHPAALLQLLEQRAQVSPSAAARRPTAKKAPRGPAATTTTTATPGQHQASQQDEAWGLRLESANRALAKWLAHEQLPVELVDSSGFQRFVRTLNQDFVPTAAGRLPDLLADEEPVRSSADAPALAALALRATCRTSQDPPSVQYQTLACRPLRVGEARIRVLTAAASLVDAQACRGALRGHNGTLGKALVGVVVDLVPDPALRQQEGGVLPVQVNDRVVASAYVPCRACSHECPHLAECMGVTSATGSLAEYVTLPVANLLVAPPSVADELLLLADDLSVAVAIGHELRGRDVRRLAIAAGPLSGSLANAIAAYLQQVLELPPDCVHIAARSSAAVLAPAAFLDLCEPQHLDARGEFDAVVDLGGSEASVDWCVRATRPMGCLLVVDAARVDPSASAAAFSDVALDLNAVVVNELDVVGVADCRDELPEAVAFVARAARDAEAAARLRALLLPEPAAFAAAREALRRAPMEAQLLVVHVGL